MATNETVKLSEEFFVDCDGTADYDNNHADCSIYGGWPYLAFQFAIKKSVFRSQNRSVRPQKSWKIFFF